VTVDDGSCVRLLLLAARSLSDPGARDGLRVAVSETSDWELVFHVASLHHLVPIVARAVLDHAADCVSAQTLEFMQRLYLANTREAGRRADHLVVLLETLKQAGIPALPLKGPVLAQSAYGDLGLRTSDDLDVLVKEKDALVAIDALRHRGFELKDPVSSTQMATILRFSCELTLVSRGAPAPVELHWSIVPKSTECRLSLEGILNRAGWVSVLGREVPWPSGIDLFMILCVHGAKHHWAQLELAHSLTELLQSVEFDWHELLREARRALCLRRCLLGALLVAEVFEATIPEEVLSMARSDSAVRRLALQVARSYSTEFRYSLPLLDEMRWNVATLDGPALRARCVLLRTFAPSSEDWAWLDLPASLYPLYYVLRPARLVLKYSRGRRSASARRASK
jgi:hypothetical protein